MAELSIDQFGKPDRRLEAFDLKKGSVVVDYGCGPGRYICKAAQMVGSNGKVFAVDINPIAIDLVEQKIETYHLTNVIPVLLADHPEAIPTHCADVIYALDMFHQVVDPETFFSRHLSNH